MTCIQPIFAIQCITVRKTKKINARVTAEVDQKLREIVRATGSSMSEIIMQSIELYYRQGAAETDEIPYEIAKRVGLIGSLSGGPKDLSTRYKQYLSEGLLAKYASSKRTHIKG